MESVSIEGIEIIRQTLLIKDYYDKVLDYEADERIGIMSELPVGSVRNIWRADGQGTSVNILEFMYNNRYAPNAGYGWKNGHLIRTSYLDDSKANQVQYIGSMKTIWREFEAAHLKHLDLQDIDIQKIERLFWFYYITKYKEKFNSGVEVFTAYIAKKRKMMSETQRAREREFYPFLANDDLWLRGCKDYLEYLIRVKTVKGFIVELVFFKALEAISGGEFIESTVEDERQGIDGFLLLDRVKYPVSIKPSTFKGGRSPVYEDRLVRYKKSGDDLMFHFATGADLLKIVEKKFSLHLYDYFI